MSQVEAAAERLANCSLIAISSGAGISAESGVPTFREAQTGLWARYDPQHLATPAAFRRNPDLVWSWYMYRYELVNAVEPNPGHYAVAELEQIADGVVILTQNVDGLHAEAGSSDIVELHGNIRRFKCSQPCQGETRYVDLAAIEYDTEHAPPCPHCEEGGFVRPDVVWFGEGLPRGALERAVQVAELCDAMLVVGTSGMVQPAASLPGLARDAGALVVEVNPNETPITRIAHIALRGPSGHILPELVDAIRKEKRQHE